MDRYHKLENIGQGSYGTVYKAQCTNGTIYALKKIPLEQYNVGLPPAAIREISLLKQLHHPNIVKHNTTIIESGCIRLHDVIYSTKSLTLVFEFLDQDLKKLLDVCQGGLDPTTVQLLLGVAYCHEHHVLHRDLKPQNLLINREGFLKLADFGLARVVGIPVLSYSHQVVTLWYRSPDVLMESEKYSTPVDIWSVGCIFAEMINGYPLFPGTHKEDQLLRIIQVLGTPPWLNLSHLQHQLSSQSHHASSHHYAPQEWSSVVPNLNPLGVDLISKMLRYDPDSRISACEALLHPYFNQ